MLTPEQVLAISQLSGNRLGGNSEGADRVRLPAEIVLGGRRAGARTVARTFRDFHGASALESVRSLLSTTQDLSRRGVFAELLGHAWEHQTPTSGRLHLIFEDMAITRSGQVPLAVGNAGGLQSQVLRSLPEQVRRRMLNDMLSILLLHPDNHGLNVMFRVAEVSDGTRIDVRLVDPFPHEMDLGSMASRMATPALGNPYADQANPNVQAHAWSHWLGLAAEAHPQAMLFIGLAHGAAAETHAIGSFSFNPVYSGMINPPLSAVTPVSGLAAPAATSGSRASGWRIFRYLNPVRWFRR